MKLIKLIDDRPLVADVAAASILLAGLLILLNLPGLQAQPAQSAFAANEANSANVVYVGSIPASVTNASAALSLSGGTVAVR